MDPRIIDFIETQKATSVCYLDAHGQPYCFSVFFAFDSKRNLLYYKSSTGSHHSCIMNEGGKVAGTVLPDQLDALAIKGVQFTGTVMANDHPLLSHAGSVYYKKMPFALAMPGTVWTLRLDTVKYTDNTLGFGKKILWKRSEETVEG